MAADHLHLTLKFLGDTDEADLPNICRALDECAAAPSPFEMQLAGTGVFPPRGSARIVWAGLQEPTGRRAGLQADLEELLAALGFKQEHRAFSPHITLARINDPKSGGAIHERVLGEAGFSGGSLHVDEVVLFQSLLSREAARYVALSRHVLGGRA